MTHIPTILPNLDTLTLDNKHIVADDELVYDVQENEIFNLKDKWVYQIDSSKTVPLRSIFGVNSEIYDNYGVKIRDPFVPKCFQNGYKLCLDGKFYNITVKQSEIVPIIDKNGHQTFDISNTIKQHDLHWQYTCRYETVKKTKDILDEENIVMIRAPPYIGKSVLLSLLKDYLLFQNMNQKVYIINGRLFKYRYDNKSKHFNQFWKEETAGIDYETMLKQNCYILIDDSQNLFNVNPDFWSQIKDIMIKSKHPTKILLTSQYGDCPITIKTLLDHKHILLTNNEYHEVLDNYNIRRLESKPFISDTSKGYIIRSTDQHVGLLIDTLDIIKNYYANKQPDDGVILMFFMTKFIGSFTISRILPPGNELHKYFKSPYIDILKGILNSWKYHVEYVNSPRIQELLIEGIVTQTHDDEDGDVITFASRSIMNIFNHRYTEATVRR